MPGVLGIYTGADVASYGTLQSALPFKSKDGTDLKKPPRRRCRPTRCGSSAIRSPAWWNSTIAEAKDASEAIEVVIELLPAITTPAQAVAKGAPAIFEDVPGNVCLDFHYGDSEKVEFRLRGAPNTRSS